MKFNSIHLTLYILSLVVVSLQTQIHENDLKCFKKQLHAIRKEYAAAESRGRRREPWLNSQDAP